MTHPDTTDKGPVRLIENDDGWFWLPRLLTEPPLVGPFVSAVRAVIHAKLAGYRYEPPMPDNEQAVGMAPAAATTELLPCPLLSIGWCESEVQIGTVGLMRFVVCEECGTEGTMAHTEAEAIAAWNKRAG